MDDSSYPYDEIEEELEPQSEYEGDGSYECCFHPWTM